MKQQVAVIGLGRFGTNVVRSLYNLGHDVAYEPYRSVEGRYHYKEISPRGRGRFSSVYERVYRHYHGRRKLGTSVVVSVMPAEGPSLGIAPSGMWM